MTRGTSIPWRALALLAATTFWALGAPAAAAAPKTQSKAEAHLANTGVQPGAVGELQFLGAPGRAELGVEAEGLTPGLAYVLTADGETWTTLPVNGEGEVKLSLSTTPKPGEPLLPDDPRGRLLAIETGGVAVLQAVLAGEGEPDDSSSSERGFLDALPAGVSAATRFEHKKSQRRFEIEVSKAPAGLYQVMVDGSIEGELEVHKDGKKTKLRFSDPAKSGKELPLDFEPRNATVEIEGPSGPLASGCGSAQLAGLNDCSESEVEVPLAAIAGVGQAKSKLRIRDDCRRKFSVEVEDVPAGVYDVYVGGVLRGTLTAAFDAGSGEVEGEIEFDTRPSDDDDGDDDELILDFDPEGALVEVMQGATLFFSGTQTPAPPGGGGGPGACTEQDVRVALLPTAAAPAASGHADFEVRADCEQKFDVEIEDVAPGSYAVRVGGVERGTLVVGPLGEGELEFSSDSDDPAELPLDFDPHGQLVEVFAGATKILERTFPN